MDSAKEPKCSSMCRLEPGKHFWQSWITADAYWLWLVQMAQNQTTISAGAKEGSAVISVRKDISGLMMSGDHSKFNVLENQHNLSLGHPQGDHLNPPAGLPMSSHSGETTPKIFLFIQRIWQLCVERVACKLRDTSWLGCYPDCRSFLCAYFCYYWTLAVTIRSHSSLHQLLSEPVTYPAFLGWNGSCCMLTFFDEHDTFCI